MFAVILGHRDLNVFLMNESVEEVMNEFNGQKQQQQKRPFRRPSSEILPEVYAYACNPLSSGLALKIYHAITMFKCE